MIFFSVHNKKKLHSDDVYTSQLPETKEEALLVYNHRNEHW